MTFEGVPDGWKPVAFRKPRRSEYYLSAHGYGVLPNSMDQAATIRCLIVAPDNVYGIPLEAVEIPKGWERAGFDVPSEDEVWVPKEGHNLGRGQCWALGDKRRILLRGKKAKRFLVVPEYELPENDRPDSVSYVLPNDYLRSIPFTIEERYE